jgi:hypothetical protein
MKTTPEAGLDTESPHAVSQNTSPGSRRIVLLGAAAFAAGLIAMVGWRLGRSSEAPGTTQPTETAAAPPVTASPAATQSVVAPPPAGTPVEVPPAASIVAASATSADVGASHKAPAPHPGAAKPAAKPDAGARAPEADPSKAAPPKRPGGLIEDVPF